MSAHVLSFEEVPGWQDADLRGTLDAFLAPTEAMAQDAAAAAQRHFSPAAPDLSTAIADLRRGALTHLDRARRPGEDTRSQRDFFERNFAPARLTVGEDAGHETGPRPGLVTGYFEAHASAARDCRDRFTVPLLRRPADLVSLASEADRARPGGPFSHMRQTASGLEPYPTRREIETAGPQASSDVIAFLADPVEAFIIHVQGSGLLQFPDGTRQRVTYDGKNGHPYTSVGKEMIRDGLIDAAEMSLDAMAAWLRAHPVEARELMWRNASYVFFRELDAEADGPLGVMGSGLIPFRSLAVDTSFHVLGLPVFVDAPELDPGLAGRSMFRELLMAHDVGSAIVGPHRGDIFYGTGPEAGRRAGATKHSAGLFALIPRELAAHYSPAGLSGRATQQE